MIPFLIGFVLVGVMPILWRSKGASLFMMLCVGRALVEVAGEEISLAARMVLNSNLPVDDIAQMIVMLAPPFMTLLVTKKAGKKKLPFHIIPSLCGGLLAGLWSVQYFAPDTFRSTPTYQYADTNSVVILLVGILMTLVLFVAEKPKPVKVDDLHTGSGKY
jgi:hypothetical protein